MRKRFLTKCVTTMLAASMLISSVGVPVNAGEMAENVLVEAGETSSLYLEEEQNTPTVSTEESLSPAESESAPEESRESSSNGSFEETEETLESENSELVEELHEAESTPSESTESVESRESESTEAESTEESESTEEKPEPLPIPTNPGQKPKDMSYLHEKEGLQYPGGYYVYYEEYVEAYSGREVGEVLDRGVIFPCAYDKDAERYYYADPQYAVVNWEVVVMGYECIKLDGRNYFNCPILKLNISLNENSKNGDWNNAECMYAFTSEAFDKTIYNSLPWRDSDYSLGYFRFIHEIEISEGITKLPVGFSYVEETFIGGDGYTGEKEHHYRTICGVSAMNQLKRISLPKSLDELRCWSIMDLEFNAIEDLFYHPNLDTIKIYNWQKKDGDDEYIGIKIAKNYSKIEMMNGFDGIIHIPSTVTEIANYSVGYKSIYYYDVKLDNVTIAGVSGSAAHKYAEENGFPFMEMGDDDELVVLRMDHERFKDHIVYFVRKKGDTYGHLLDKEFEIKYEDGIAMDSHGQPMKDENGNWVPRIITEQYVVDYFEDKDGNRITEDTVVPTERNHVVYVRCHLKDDENKEESDSAESAESSETQESSFEYEESVADEVEEEDRDVAEEAKMWVGGVKGKVSFTGSSITFPGLRVYDGKTLLKDGVDYSVKYYNNKNVGTATIKITGKGLYKGKLVQKTFEIAPVDIGDYVVSNGSSVYNRKMQKPSPTLSLNGKKLVKNKDYTVSYENGVAGFTEIGTYTITLTGKGNYTGTKTSTYRIVDKNAYTLLSKVSVSKVKSKVYTGSQIVQDEYVVKYGKNVLTEGVDYTVSYVNNTNVGTATMVLTAVEGSKYIGEKTVNFKITGTPISKAKVTVNYQDSKKKYFVYTGLAIKPTFTVQTVKTKTTPAETLTEGVDYTVTYQKNKAKGTGYILLTGKGKYTGTKKVSFKITAMKMTDENTQILMSKKDYQYTGKSIKPEIKVVVNGKVLVEGYDYTVSYTNNKKVAASDSRKAPTITVKGKGNYIGSVKATFSIAN